MAVALSTQQRWGTSCKSCRNCASALSRPSLPTSRSATRRRPPPPTTGPQLPAAARQDPLPPGLPNGPGGNASHYLHCPPHEPRHGQRDGGRHHAEKMDLVCGLGIELVTEEHDRRPKWYCASQVVGSKLRRTGTDPQWQATTADSLRVDGNPLPPNHPPAGPHLGDGSGRRSSGPAGQVSRPPPPTAPSRLHCGRA